ncbi:MAG: hypothetical protein ACTTGJ_03740 [Clostridium sp.]
MGIKKINKNNTSSYISDQEIIEIHYKLINTFINNLKVYGVKPLWKESFQDIKISKSDIKNMNDKELQIIFLYKYKNCFVHKDLVSEFVRMHKPNAGLDQQVRHLGTQYYWYILNKGARVPDTEEIVPSGYNYLVSIEIPNPKSIKMAFKRANRNSAKNFIELKYVYDNRCATCGVEEEKMDWRTGKKVKLQQGHMDPRKDLTLDNTIPQCEYCNQTYLDYFRFNENGRVIAINNPEILLKSPKDIQDEMIDVLLKERQKNNL